MTRRIFHLSIPVDDLNVATRFYLDMLGAAVGRSEATWIDMLLWGHQITLQLEPQRVSPDQGKRHFGVTLPWADWDALQADITKRAPDAVIAQPVIKHAGTPNEQAKFYLQDPAHNVIEIKTYRDFQHVLGTDDPAFDPEQ